MSENPSEFLQSLRESRYKEREDNTASNLLSEVSERGWKQENPLIDTSWAIPIDLYWKINKFLGR